MKCSKCGAEIEAGSVFCKKCGEPVQMVPDYNILEDDFLISLLEEEKSAGKTEVFLSDWTFCPAVSG